MRSQHVVAFVLIALWISTEYRNFKRESESMRHEFMASMKGLVMKPVVVRDLAEAVRKALDGA